MSGSGASRRGNGRHPVSGAAVLAVALAVTLAGCSMAGARMESGSPAVDAPSAEVASGTEPSGEVPPEPSVVVDPPPTASDAPEPTTSDPGASASGPVATEEIDPVRALAGRPVEALAGQDDAILRLGEPGWAVPGEAIFDVSGERVLTAVAGPGDEKARLRVRDLAGDVIREIDVDFNLPQTGIVRGDVVIYAGVQLAPDADPFEPDDRGVWVVRGDRPPERIADPADTFLYRGLFLSPDGRTIGAEACGLEACRSVLIPETGQPRVIERPGLTALTDEAAVFLVSWSGIAGVGVADGVERWAHEVDGVNWARYAMADGRHIVHMTTLDGDEPGTAADVFRIEVIDATTGDVRTTIDLPIDDVRWSLQPSLSTDRYGVLVPSVLPNAADAPLAVLVIDLADGSTLDVDLELQPIGGS